MNQRLFSFRLSQVWSLFLLMALGLMPRPDAHAQIITTVAGTGTAGYSGDNGAATDAKLSYSFGVAVDASGNLYIADQNNHRIRRVSTNGTITTVAGTGTIGYIGDNGAATDAKLNNPTGVAVDASGNLYIADYSNHRIRRVSTNGTITTVAGTGTTGYSGDNGAATNAQLNYPVGLAVDASGNLYIADQYNHCIRRVSTSGTITTVAGAGISGYSGDNGAATNAQLNNPFGVVVDASGNLYIADQYNHRIRRVSTSGTITTVAGTGTAGYSGDIGAATDAKLNYPVGVVVDASGNLYIADFSNHRIRRVSTSGTITTVAGAGISGYSGDNGAATNAQLNYPVGVVVDASGNLYIADYNNHRVRRVGLASSIANLSSLALSAGTLTPAFAAGTTTYTASVSNETSSITLTPTLADATATVKINGTTVSSGAASASIPLNVGANTISVEVTAQDGTTQKTYTVTVTRAAPAATVTITPAELAAICSGSGLNLTATPTGFTPTTYTWTSSPAGFIGSGASPTLTIPSVNAQTAYTITITATDGTASATAQVFVVVKALPTVNLTNDGPLSCAKSTVTLSAVFSAGEQNSIAGLPQNTYVFSAGAKQIGGSTGNTADVTASGVYSVTATDAYGCAAIAQTKVSTSVSSPLKPDLGKDRTVVQNTALTLTNSAACVGTLVWGQTAGGSATGTGSIVVPTTATGTFSYSALCQVDDCPSPVATVTITVTPPATPTLTATPTVLSGFVSEPGINSMYQTYTLQPANLTNPITITPPAGVEVMVTSVECEYTSLLVVPASDEPITVYVRLTGANSVVDGIITNGSGSASANVVVNGTVKTPVPTLSVNPDKLTGFTATEGTTSAEQSFQISGTNIPADKHLIIKTTEGFEVREKNGNYGPTMFNNLSGSFTATFYVRTTNQAPKGPLNGKLIISIDGLDEPTATVALTATIDPAPVVNTAPTVAQTVAPQSATVGQVFSFAIPAGTFTDAQTPNQLSVSVSGLPAGLSFADGTISGTPQSEGTSPVTITATDPGDLSVSTSFILTIKPAVTTSLFAITGVSVVSCESVSEGQRRVTFTPQYAGLSSEPVSFWVQNEMLPTTDADPYSLRLYTDNPTITLMAQQGKAEVSFSYNWLAACSEDVTPPPTTNTAPTVVNTIPAQSATVGQTFSFAIPQGTFTDAQTPNQLSVSVSGLPTGLSFAEGTISGTPQTAGTSTIIVTATDPGNLSVSTSFGLTVNPAPVNPDPTTAPFAITAVTTVSCESVTAGQRRVTFTPQYAGLSGQPVSFWGPNEMLPTTNAGPYTVRLYIDNPTITLNAQQGSATTRFTYNWLAVCSGTITPTTNTAPTVVNPIPAQSATVGQAFSFAIPQGTFTDAQTPNQLSVSVSGLPAGLSFADGTISGTPQSEGTSPVTITATDPGTLAVSTQFTLTVNPAPVNPDPTTAPFAITGVSLVNCESVTAGQRKVTFTPQYAGLSGQPVNFWVTNEMLPTTSAGPYTLSLYTDNATIMLKAQQSGTAGEVSFSYNWLAACSSNGRLGAEPTSPLTVLVLGNPVVGESVEAEVRGAAGQTLRLQTVNGLGRVISQTTIGQAAPVERITLGLEPSAGVYFLQVSTPTQRQVIKVVKP